ncbi:MAG: hypothetical protein U9R39_10005 [Campylobacterota bacterium]|nr:hypothetical protein [Campylobacterota bacterium]
MKRAVVLLEVIFSIVLFSIIASYSVNILLSLNKKKNLTTFQTHNNIKLETTRLFLIKNNNFADIKYENSVLYFKNNILLDNISSYNLNILNKIATIDICIYDNTICQKWKIKSL